MLKPQKAILSALIDFVNDGATKIPKGPIFDSRGEVVANLQFPLSSVEDWESSREEGRDRLNQIVDLGHDWGIAYVNSNCPRVVLWYENEGGVSVPIPVAGSPADFTAVALFLAYSTPTGVGDSLGHRICHCEWCKRFFLRKTKKKSRFCQDSCRYGYYNSKKKEPA